MAITTTTVASAVAVGDLSINLASATGALIKNVVHINGEYLTQTADVVGTVLAVRRGEQGTYNQAHASGSVVQMGLASDFPSAPPGQAVPNPYSPAWTVASYNAAGAITVPTLVQNVFVKLKSGAGSAMTIGDPGAAVEGVEMIIQAEDAQAYTITNATGFNGGGGGADVATFGGAVGDNLHIKAVSGTWKSIATRAVTIA